MAKFCQQYPGIQLEISVYDGSVNIIEERFDLGIRFGDILEGGVVALTCSPLIICILSLYQRAWNA